MTWISNIISPFTILDLFDSLADHLILNVWAQVSLHKWKPRYRFTMVRIKNEINTGSSHAQITTRPQRSLTAQEFFHLRASLWQMSASAFGFWYRLLRRAVACGTFLKFHSSFAFIDQILLSLSDSLLFLCSLVPFHLTSFSWISAMDLYLAANTRQDEDVSILDFSSSHASKILCKRRSSSANTRVVH